MPTNKMKVEAILLTVTKYAKEFSWKPDKWDAVNYCIGYYGSVNQDHIEAIHQAVAMGIIKEHYKD